MALQLVLKERMSGWIEFQDDSLPKGRHEFVFDVDASTSAILNFGAVRECTGTVSFGHFHRPVPVEGELVLQLGGPSYDMQFTLDGIGSLHLAGRKTYDVRRLIPSMTTLPLLVYRQGRIVGEAELVYRDSVLTFPLKALRLRLA
ncbi:MAG: hypothetical protein Q8J78_13300 [Moraxellaceae bacterium]|nr:hypothetical protein [Moraxellaceae bacterium]